MFWIRPYTSLNKYWQNYDARLYGLDKFELDERSSDQSYTQIFAELVML